MKQRICLKCGEVLPKNKIHEHHIIPKEWGGTDADGRIHLCEDHHTGKNGIHNLLPKVIPRTKQNIIEFTTSWLREDDSETVTRQKD
jgi:hypothetical protein